MTDKYELGKWLWTESDFEIMGWHDSRIYALAFAPEKSEIIFDIDYIFQWVSPQEGEVSFSFWVSPATLVFENIYNIEFDLGLNDGELEIDVIKRELIGAPRNAQYIGKNEEWIWIIECQQDEIKFRSAGYKMHVRAKPKFGHQQIINPETRQVSFDRGSAN